MASAQGSRTTHLRGSCKLCFCKYMGDGETASCECGHGTTQHVILGGCEKDGCQCSIFTSTRAVQQCYNCLHDSCYHEETCNKEFESLKHWVLESKSQAAIVREYNKKFSTSINSVRTLQRKLKEYKIKHSDDKSINDEDLINLMKRENENGVIGYNRMWQVIRVKYQYPVTRDRVQRLIQDNGLPRGDDPKLKKKFHAKPFCSKGPNWLWSADGHEKVAQPYGLYIYAIIDTFSRKLMTIDVVPNKKADTIKRWLLNSIIKIDGMPSNIQTDKGSEWSGCSDLVPMIQMKSVFNQKIEAFWAQLRKASDIQWYKEELRSLENDGHLDPSDDGHRFFLWLTYGQALKISLKEFQLTYNLHVIRKQANVDLPTGYSPNTMWESPELFETENFMQPVLENLAEEIADKSIQPSVSVVPSKHNVRELFLKMKGESVTGDPSTA